MPNAIPSNGLGVNPQEGSNLARSSPSLTNIRTFACPYLLKAPHKFASKKCASSGWSTVERLKEHSAPLHCPNCLKEFQVVEAYENHLADPFSCEEMLWRSDQDDSSYGFGSDQLLRLCTSDLRYEVSDRHKSDHEVTSPKMTLSCFETEKPEEEKWYEVYQILFSEGGCSEMPYPYIDILEEDTELDVSINQELFKQLEPLMIPHEYSSESLTVYDEAFKTIVNIKVQNIVQGYFGKYYYVEPHFLNQCREFVWKGLVDYTQKTRESFQQYPCSNSSLSPLNYQSATAMSKITKDNDEFQAGCKMLFALSEDLDMNNFSNTSYVDFTMPKNEKQYGANSSFMAETSQFGLSGLNSADQQSASRNCSVPVHYLAFGHDSDLSGSVTECFVPDQTSKTLSVETVKETNHGVVRPMDTFVRRDSTSDSCIAGQSALVAALNTPHDYPDVNEMRKRKRNQNGKESRPQRSSEKPKRKKGRMPNTGRRPCPFPWYQRSNVSHWKNPCLGNGFLNTSYVLDHIKTYHREVTAVQEQEFKSRKKEEILKTGHKLDDIREYTILCETLFPRSENQLWKFLHEHFNPHSEPRPSTFQIVEKVFGLAPRHILSLLKDFENEIVDTCEPKLDAGQVQQIREKVSNICSTIELSFQNSILHPTVSPSGLDNSQHGDSALGTSIYLASIADNSSITLVPPETERQVSDLRLQEFDEFSAPSLFESPFHGYYHPKEQTPH